MAVPSQTFFLFSTSAVHGFSILYTFIPFIDPTNKYYTTPLHTKLHTIMKAFTLLGAAALFFSPALAQADLPHVTILPFPLVSSHTVRLRNSS